MSRRLLEMARKRLRDSGRISFFIFPPVVWSRFSELYVEPEMQLYDTCKTALVICVFVLSISNSFLVVLIPFLPANVKCEIASLPFHHMARWSMRMILA